MPTYAPRELALHSAAMCHPDAAETHIVMLMQDIHDMIEGGYGRSDFRDAVIHMLHAVRILADDHIGRLSYPLLLEFYEYGLDRCNYDKAVDVRLGAG